MRDLSRPYRLAIYAVLNGVISVPVYDEKKKVASTETTFVILSTQQQTPVEENDCTWISRCSIDIEVIQKTGFEVTKDDIDDISNQICGILLPSQGITPIESPNLQFTLPEIESIISRNVSITEPETVIVKILRFVCTIIQQTS